MNLFQKALDHFGPSHQIVKTMEECGELIQALAKCHAEYHADDDDPTKWLDATRALLGELADVQIMILQMKEFLGANSFDAVLTEKMQRLQDKLNTK